MKIFSQGEKSILKKNKFARSLSFGILILTFNISFGQVNVIDVPNADITEKAHLFFQQEFEVSDRNLQTAQTYSWGLGKNLEAGFNIHQLTFNTRPRSRLLVIDKEEPEDTPDLMLNVKKAIQATDWLKFALGTQTGINIASHRSEILLANFSYANSQLSIPDTKNFLVIGGYYTTTGYGGEGTRLGFMAGAEAEIIKDKLSLIGDFLSGRNSLSVINAGIEISLPKNWQIDLALQLPMPGTDNSHGGVIQISRK